MLFESVSGDSICGVKHAEKSQDNAQGESFCPKNLNVSHRRGF